MAFDVEFLDCCGKPSLEVVERITTDDHNWQSLCRCLSCGAHWFHRFYEYIHFDVDLPDDQISWYVPLTEPEARLILQSEEHPNLSFLANRRCFRQDERSVSPNASYPLF